MSSAAANKDNPLELIQKTYTNNVENLSQHRSSVNRASNHHHHLSRKTSVHDVHEFTREHFNKTIGEIHENLSRLKVLLETMNSAANARDEFYKLKDFLFVKIIEFISKLANESGKSLNKRGSISSKGNNSNLILYHPQHLVYCIESFRSELIRAQYLFSSLTLSASIGSATLETIFIKPVSLTNIQQTSTHSENFQDLIQMNKDIINLEEHAYVLTQRYYSQIPDWHTLDDATGGLMIGASGGLDLQRLRVAQLPPKMSTTSSTISIERSTFFARLFKKCQIVCCICTPKYI